MNRQLLLWRVYATLVALLLIPVLALAQSPYEGIYIGSYQGIGDDGEFALIVNDRGRATLAAYDAVDDKGYIENNIYFRADGSFRFTTLDGTHIEGQATTSDISGRYFATGTQGNFIGLRAADDGPLQDAAGLYSGPVSATGTGPDSDIHVNGRLFAIIAADGTAFFMLNHGLQNNPDTWPGDMDFGFDLGFGDGFDFDFDFNSTFPFNSRFNPQFPFGSGQGHFAPFNFGPGSCRPFQAGNWFGWPFNFNLDYSFHLSVLGLIDLDFDFSLPTCSNFLPWNDFSSPLGDSGGLVQVDPDGVIQAELLDGLELQGFLDTAAARAEGELSLDQGLITWSGHWSIERHGNSGNLEVIKALTQLTDVNGDGFADITWQHTVTGESAVWLMDGDEMVAELPLVAQLDSKRELQWSATDPSWTARAMTDFDGDGDADALMTNPHTADLMIRLMENQMPVQETYLEEDQYGQYELAGVGDFDGDGAVDIIWHDHVAGLAIVTVRPGRDSAENIPLGPAVAREWHLAAVGDLNGDGSDDLVWRNALTGENVTWQIFNTQVVGESRLMPVADLRWVIQP